MATVHSIYTYTVDRVQVNAYVNNKSDLSKPGQVGSI